MGLERLVRKKDCHQNLQAPITNVAGPAFSAVLELEFKHFGART